VLDVERIEALGAWKSKSTSKITSTRLVEGVG
jgi:hypothetical protein